MKKLLFILGTISLSTIITTNIIACNISNENNEPNKPIKPKFIAQQPPKNSNGKLINIKWQKDMNKFENEFKKLNNKGYFFIEHDTYGFNKYLAKNNGNNIKQVNVGHGALILNNGGYAYFDASKIKSIYCGDGINKPIIPTINKNTGEITKGNEGIKI